MSVAFKVTARRGAFHLDVAFETAVRAIAVVGASGAGKTTLLQGLAGLTPVTRARLVLDGQTLVDTDAGVRPAAHRRGVGYVFQDGRLFPHLRVGANVGFARPYATDPMSVDEALRLVDLEGFEDRWPASLSGGEARRAALARALLPRPKLLLLDEPFSGLDEGRRAALIPYLIRLRDQAGVRIIVVSHDRRDVEALGQALLTLDGGAMVPVR